MKLKPIIAILAAVMFMTSINISAQSKGDKLPPIKYKEFTLKNGLRVVFHEDKSTPVVAVNVWYHVGSKNEAAGRTGFAHLFEHMMFQGSKNYNTDYFTPLQEAGGNVNGTTDQDRTYYYEVVPSNFLELALFLEADRLGGLTEAMTQEKLDNQRDVVKNERRQRVDNQPYGTAAEKIGEIMFPKGHPYNWSVIGSLEDLSAASLDDVTSFFKQYYTPNNAVLVLAGDFDEKQAKTWVEKYFGPIAKGNAITRPNPAMPKLDKEIRVSVDDPLAPLPRIYMAWHGVREYSADEAALDMLGSILSGGRTSRLQSNLVYGKEIAQQAVAYNSTSEIAGMFQTVAIARPGKSLSEVEKAVDAEIDRIKKEAPTADEVSRALNGIEAQSIYSLQTVLGKGSQMSSYAGYVGNPNYFQANLDRYRKVTAADIQRVANTYLTANRLVMEYLPKKEAGPGGARAANKPSSVKTEKKDTAKIAAQTANLPKPGPNPKLMLPPIGKSKLSNGLEIWTVHQNELPIVSMNLVFKSGSAVEPSDRKGVAGFTASLLDSGTKNRSVEEISNQLQSIGASVNAGGSWDSTSVSMQTLTRNLDKALDIYADVITNPIFPEKELESLRRRSLVGLQQQKSNPNAIGNNVYNKVLYGDLPYGRNNNEQTIKAITRDDLVKYYGSTYIPNNAVLIVAGNFDEAALKQKLEGALGNWKGGTAVSADMPSPKDLDKTAIYLVDRPGSAQSVLSIGRVGIERSNPDYFPVTIMNSILGGAITSRVSMNLREEKGYTYGAGSGFTFRKNAGPFTASADVQTAVTKESVFEFMKELNGMRGQIPITQQELDYNKQSLIRRYPGAFETVGGMSGQLANLAVYNLPDSYFNDFIAKVNAVTIEDVNRVALKYLDTSKMAIVVVGDRKVIEGSLKELGYPIVYMDTDGNVTN